MHSLLLAFCCTVTVHVHTPSGAPLASAQVVMHGPRTYTASTDASGNASLTTLGGSYHVDTTAKGYVGVSIDLDLKETASVDVTLEPLDAPTLRTIGTVRVDGRLTPIRGTIPSITVTRADMDRLGDDRVIDALAALPGATFTRPDGGGANAIAVVSLRGPDPSESLVTLDDQLLNDGNTGDLDLARFPVAAFSAIDVTEGLGPEDSNGSNTFGGSINFVSLEPTLVPHVAFAIGSGSFGQSQDWLNATGTQGRLGYGIALSDSNETGYTHQYETLYLPNQPIGCPANCGTPTLLGSSVASRLGLINTTWSFSQNASITARVFVLGDNSDQSSAVNGIDDYPTTTNTAGQTIPNPTYGSFIGPGASTLAQNIRAYQLRGQVPLGAGELTADLYQSDNGITFDGGSYSPYDVTHLDNRYNGGLTWQRTFATAQFAVGGYTRYESLAFPGSASSIPDLGQTINVIYARGGFQPTAKLRLDGGIFESHYTTFGANLDGRFGAIYNTDPKTALRFSIGTGFRAPLLYERYQYPLADLAQDALGVFIGQGNPNENSEHATEYELGISHEFQTSTLDFSLYQTNLRDPIEIYYPFALAQSGACAAQTPTAPVPGCVSYNSNVGNAVYQGVEVRYVRRFVPQHLFLTAMYGLNVAYPKDLNADYSNPTSAGSLVDNTQFLGIPQQQGSLELDWTQGNWHAATDAIFRGSNNELNQGPFTWIDASVGYKINSECDLTLIGTNLFNDAAGRFTQIGGGVPYLGVDDTELSTNRLFVEPFGLRFVFTTHI